MAKCPVCVWNALAWPWDPLLYTVYKYRPPASPPLYILALDQQWATLIWVWPICVSYTVYIVPQHTQGVFRNVHTYACTHFMTL